MTFLIRSFMNEAIAMVAMVAMAGGDQSVLIPI